MGIFTKKKIRKRLEYNKEKERPVVRCSICNGERVAGFMEYGTKNFREVAFIRDNAELEDFKESCGVEGDIEKIY